MLKGSFSFIGEYENSELIEDNLVLVEKYFFRGGKIAPLDEYIDDIKESLFYELCWAENLHPECVNGAYECFGDICVSFLETVDQGEYSIDVEFENFKSREFK